MPTLKMYIGSVVIDKVEADYSVCETVHEKDEMSRAAVDFLKDRNWQLMISGFIPTFYLHCESKMNEAEYV